MRTLRHPPQPCPVCQYKLDAVSDLMGINSPSVESLTICINCAAILEFKPGFVLAKLNDLELSSMAVTQPQNFAKLMRYRDAALEVKSNSKKKSRRQPRNKAVPD